MTANPSDCYRVPSNILYNIIIIKCEFFKTIERKENGKTIL